MDQIQNFIKEAVNGGHDGAAVTINVNDASDFPDPASGEYNVTWWDITNYPDPADDPNVEIVRVTARDTGADTLTVTRAQEGTAATTKNTGGATYMMILALTKKTIDDILAEAGDVAADTVAADEATTAADADLFALIVGGVLKKLTFAALKLAIWAGFKPPEGFTINIKFVPSVASNNLTLALKGLDGNDHSATNPGYVMIGGTLRMITAALSVTKNAGTNWCNAGSAELATKEIDYPAFLSYNATDGVIIAFARFFGTIFSDFSATTTNEKYVACSAANSAATDPFVVIGRFAATLSAGAGYTWSVPTFTATNLIQRPIYETRWLDYAPAFTGFSSNPVIDANNTARYKIKNQECLLNVQQDSGTSNATGYTMTVPFAAVAVQHFLGQAVDAGTAGADPGYGLLAVGSTITFYKTLANGTWTASGAKRMVHICNPYQI